MKALIFDIELYKNLFLVVFYNVETQEYFEFEISSRKNDTLGLGKFLFNHSDYQFVGFNCIAYDSPMLNCFLANGKQLKDKPIQLLQVLNKKNAELGQAMKKGIRVKSKSALKIIDLFLIHHFDNVAKMTSLKELEFNMKMENIQELPYPFGSVLTNEEIEEVVKYCRNDVLATYLFYQHSLKAIKFRERFSPIYGLDFANANDVKIGEEILIDALIKELGWTREQIKGMRTHRKEMRVDEIILPCIQFSSIEFQTLVTWWKTKIITETKGQFSEIPLEEVQPIFPYTNKELKSKGTKLAKLNIVYKGFQFDLGTGGIHGILKPGIWIADEQYDILLVDVSSYYPNMAKVNGFHPAHFPREIFGNIISILYQQRMEGKAIGDEEVVKAIKLALNGSLYGRSNSEFSPLYDPMMMMKICINGQLLLMVACEKFLDEGIEIIQVNTDGIMLYCPKNKRDIVSKICKDWMELTKLKLDTEEFNLVAQKDCNNYLARYSNGKIKSKGAAFAYKELDWYKDFSGLVIQKAVEAYFLNNISPQEFISNHLLTNENLYDFFCRVKLTDSSHKLYGVIGENRHRLQKITRYFIAKEGMKLEKEMPPLKGKENTRISEVEKGFLVVPCNNLAHFNPDEVRNNINQDYYVQKALDIINAIISPKE